ncbi:MAG: hypothetical protein ABIO96_06555 [Nitrospiraceae bacterium]
MIHAILGVLIVGLIAGLTGIIWMVVSDIVSNDPSPNDKRQGGTHQP